MLSALYNANTRQIEFFLDSFPAVERILDCLVTTQPADVLVALSTKSSWQHCLFSGRDTFIIPDGLPLDVADVYVSLLLSEARAEKGACETVETTVLLKLHTTRRVNHFLLLEQGTVSEQRPLPTIADTLLSKVNHTTYSDSFDERHALHLSIHLLEHS
ncbi:hypothetical protein ADEAN_000149000 [Angomonas deanei]|uniref:Uncharacterized protein n=1 Tax=Angomonas deanei TaxID=59799 RepID=A0A7G2C2Z1_9TRYP|nr:hypothetical protein ADEAN_000149000 [Angomonas deanei]